MNACISYGVDKTLDISSIRYIMHRTKFWTERFLCRLFVYTIWPDQIFSSFYSFRCDPMFFFDVYIMRFQSTSSDFVDLFRKHFHRDKTKFTVPGIYKKINVHVIDCILLKGFKTEMKTSCCTRNEENDEIDLDICLTWRWQQHINRIKRTGSEISLSLILA
jgi:hypothetical protein